MNILFLTSSSSQFLVIRELALENLKGFAAIKKIYFTKAPKHNFTVNKKRLYCGCITSLASSLKSKIYWIYTTIPMTLFPHWLKSAHLTNTVIKYVKPFHSDVLDYNLSEVAALDRVVLYNLYYYYNKRCLMWFLRKSIFSLIM